MLIPGLLGWALVRTTPCAAQEERPQITPGERQVPRKKDAGPRALGILQVGSNGKASLIPVAILINGKFWDATAYKADPIPMALESGVVYEGERAGSTQGLFTVSSALHSNVATAPNPWIGTGAWLPYGAEKASGLKAEVAPVGIDSSEGPPRLTRHPAAATAPASSPTEQPKSAPTSAPPPSGSGDDPPRLIKPAPSNEPPARAPASDSPGGDDYRPTLRRGKPVQTVEEEIAGYSKPGAKPSSSPAKPELVAGLGPVQLIPAISDAGGPQPRMYTFEWIKGEEDERRKQMLDLAKQQLRAYLLAQAKARIAPTTKAPQRSAAKKAPEPVLENVKMVAYDLWTTNQPVLILSAEAHLPPPPPGSQGGFETDLQYSVMLVAYPDMYNSLRKLYSGITDKYHLDLTPRLELIDAVDADGDGRGELLFRETSDAGSGWVVYRATADKLWKMFDSLNPE